MKPSVTADQSNVDLVRQDETRRAHDKMCDTCTYVSHSSASCGCGNSSKKSILLTALFHITTSASVWTLSSFKAADRVM